MQLIAFFREETREILLPFLNCKVADSLAPKLDLFPSAPLTETRTNLDSSPSLIPGLKEKRREPFSPSLPSTLLHFFG